MSQPVPESEADVQRWNLLQQRLQQVRTVRAVGFLRSHGIDPLVIKGSAAARYYPEGKYRVSTDVDLAVAPVDFERAHKLVTRSEAAGMAIDLHNGLRHLDTACWDDLYAHSVPLALDGSEVRALRPEDDLRVLTVHWLTDGGVYRQRLWDLTYLVEHERHRLDWGRVFDPVSPVRRRWLECALGLASRYAGLNLSGTPLDGASERLPAWLIRTVEAEWASDVKPWPLEASLGDSRLLLAQIRRRMQPNPIYATVDCEGSFDARTRFFYRLRNGIRRVGPSYGRISAVLRNRARGTS